MKSNLRKIRLVKWWLILTFSTFIKRNLCIARVGYFFIKNILFIRVSENHLQFRAKFLSPFFAVACTFYLFKALNKDTDICMYVQPLVSGRLLFVYHWRHATNVRHSICC